MDFDKEGRRIPSAAEVLLVPKKRGRGRPRKYPQDTSVAAAGESNEVQPYIKKHGRGRPRKYASKTSVKTKISMKKTTDTKIKLKLLESIFGVYKEIKSIEDENQKNIKKFYALVDGLD